MCVLLKGFESLEERNRITGWRGVMASSDVHVCQKLVWRWGEVYWPL